MSSLSTARRCLRIRTLSHWRGQATSWPWWQMSGAIFREAVSAAVQQVRATGPQAIIGVLNGVSAPAEGRAQRIPVYEPQPVDIASEAPAILADAVPPRGPNGQHREQSGAPHPYSRQPRDTETGPDDGPGSGEAHR